MTTFKKRIFTVLAVALGVWCGFPNRLIGDEREPADSTFEQAPLIKQPILVCEKEPDLRLGVLSDLHVHLGRGDDARSNPQVARFRKALEYFRARRVDGVLVCGDLTDRGWDTELKAVADTWFEVFPEGKLPDGRPVANLMHYGDHDAETRFWKPTEGIRSLSVGDFRKTYWEECFREKWQPVQVKRVKGYAFVLAHFVRETPGANAELAGVFASLGVKGDEPIFVSQHRPPAGTWHAKWGPDAGTNEKIYEKYPNAVVFSGHEHYMQTDDRTVWQKGFTAINVGALLNQSVDRLHENGPLIPWIAEDAKRDADMPCVQADRTHGGMMMTVAGDRAVLERLDFETDRPLGADLEFRLCGTSAVSAANTTVAPIFPPKATIRVSCENARTRRGKPFKAVRVEFPVANALGAHPRAHDYRVRALDANGRVIREHLVFSSAANRPEDLDTEPVVCLFNAADLGGAVRVSVEPRSCWGAVGSPLVALVASGILHQIGQGRSTHYDIGLSPEVK